MEAITSTLVPDPEAARKHAIRAQYAVRQLDNPNPLVIILGCLIVMIVIYLMHLCNKRCISGWWASSASGKVYVIKHNVLTDAVWLTGGGSVMGGSMPGYLDGGILVFPGKSAALINDTITWLDGDQWNQLPRLTY